MQNEIKNEFDQMPDYKLLELLLEGSVPDSTAVALAHELLLTFGDLAGVLESDRKELAAVNGMTKAAAQKLLLCIPMFKAYERAKGVFNPDFNCIDTVGDFLLRKYVGKKQECASVTLLDAGGNLVDFRFVSNGDVGVVGVSVKKVLDLCVQKQATACILAHNHTNGIAIPSPQDIVNTEQMAKILKECGILLLDHLILGKGDFVSMAQSKEYAHIFTL